MTVAQILTISEEFFKKKEIENPRLNAELLLADTLNTERINLYLNFDKPLSPDEINSYREKVRRRLNHEPLQYILGCCEFFGMKFRVTPDVLIPRPETETLVEEALKIIKSKDNSRVLDIGTGSGCIAIALGKNSNCAVDGIDTNSNALDVARKNAELNGIENVYFSAKNLFQDFESFKGYDLVVSNPPYIPSEEIQSLPSEIKDFEPRNALTDGGDGLDYYRKIIELIKKTPDNLTVLLEIGDRKRSRVEQLLRQNSIENYTFIKDLMKIDRVVKLEK